MLKIFLMEMLPAFSWSVFHPLFLAVLYRDFVIPFSVILTQLNLYATVNSVGFLPGLLVRNSKITSMLCVYIQNL